MKWNFKPLSLSDKYFRREFMFWPMMGLSLVFSSGFHPTLAMSQEKIFGVLLANWSRSGEPAQKLYDVMAKSNNPSVKYSQTVRPGEIRTRFNLNDRRLGGVNPNSDGYLRFDETYHLGEFWCKRSLLGQGHLYLNPPPSGRPRTNFDRGVFAEGIAATTYKCRKGPSEEPFESSYKKKTLPQSWSTWIEFSNYGSEEEDRNRSAQGLDLTDAGKTIQTLLSSTNYQVNYREYTRMESVPSSRDYLGHVEAFFTHERIISNRDKSIICKMTESGLGTLEVNQSLIPPVTGGPIYQSINIEGPQFYDQNSVWYSCTVRVQVDLELNIKNGVNRYHKNDLENPREGVEIPGLKLVNRTWEEFMRSPLNRIRPRQTPTLFDLMEPELTVSSEFATGPNGRPELIEKLTRYRHIFKCEKTRTIDLQTNEEDLSRTTQKCTTKFYLFNNGVVGYLDPNDH